MPHETALIVTLAAGFGLAFTLGLGIGRATITTIVTIARSVPFVPRR